MISAMSASSCSASIIPPAPELAANRPLGRPQGLVVVLCGLAHLENARSCTTARIGADRDVGAFVAGFGDGLDLLGEHRIARAFLGSLACRAHRRIGGPQRQ